MIASTWFLRYAMEAVGMATFIIILNLASANVKQTSSKVGKLLVGAAYGVGLSVVILAFSNTSGSFFNPAYTIGLATIGAVKWGIAGGYLIAQIIGAIIGQLIVVGLSYKHYQEMEDATDVLAAFATIDSQDDRTYAQRGSAWIHGAVNEFLTSLVFFMGVLGLTNGYIGSESVSYIYQAAQQQGSTDATGLQIQSQMYTYGSKALAFLVIGLFAGAIVAATGASLNPFRDLGPRLVHFFLPKSVLGDSKDDSRWWYAWVPLVMPFLAAIAAASIFKIMFKI